MAQDIAGTLEGVFGESSCVLKRTGEPDSEITVIFRRDVEIVDDSGQAVEIENLLKFAHINLPYTPKRGDTVTLGSVVYTLGRRISDTGYFIEMEATK